MKPIGWLILPNPTDWTKQFFLSSKRLTVAGLKYGLQEERRANGVRAYLFWGEHCPTVKLQCLEIGTEYKGYSTLKEARAAFESFGRTDPDMDKRFYKQAIKRGATI